MLRRLAPALLLLAVLAAPGAAALRIPPPPDHRVNDYAGALAPADRDRLEQALIAREATSRNQVVVAIFRSLEGESLEDYSIRLAKAWRIGQKGLDNGVIFLVFLDDRKMRIEVGYGLEGSLTDAISSSILRDVVAPRFRAGQGLLSFPEIAPRLSVRDLFYRAASLQLAQGKLERGSSHRDTVVEQRFSDLTRARCTR